MNAEVSLECSDDGDDGLAEWRRNDQVIKLDDPRYRLGNNTLTIVKAGMHTLAHLQLAMKVVVSKTIGWLEITIPAHLFN